MEGDNKIVNTTHKETANDKEVRYDRQLRLWGRLGQEGIENIRLGVLGSNSTAAETLKNLVLPGIGEYEVIDDALVTERDLGNHFYVTKESKGKSRAEEIVINLNEMNPFVKGIAHKVNPVKLIETNVEYFKKFNVICASQMPTSAVKKLAKFAWENKIPLFVQRSYGFLGYLRIAIPELDIYENHDPEFKDLRLNDPFPEFIHFCENFDIDVHTKEENKNLTAEERIAKHSDIPWLILAPILRKRFKEKHPNEDLNEESFQKFVKENRLDDPKSSGKKADEENYDELSANSWLVSNYEEYYEIPNSVQEIFEDPKINVNSDSGKFWVLAAALKSFVAKEGNNKHLPLTGSLPDMHGTSANYLSLQSVFKDKSNRDFKCFREHFHVVHNKVGTFKHFTSISDEEVERFFKNCRFIEAVKYRSLEEEHHSWNVDSLSTLLMSTEWDNNAKNVVWYLLLRSVDSFFDKHARYPGDTNSTYESDIKSLQEIVHHLVKESSLDFSHFQNLNDYAHEMTRYGAAELHNVASIVGGTVAQEVIKVVTGQWVAVNNTWIFSGLDSSSLQFQA